MILPTRTECDTPDLRGSGEAFIRVRRRRYPRRHYSRSAAALIYRSFEPKVCLRAGRSKLIRVGVNRRVPCADTHRQWISDPFYVQGQSTASPVDFDENQVPKIHHGQ